VFLFKAFGKQGKLLQVIHSKLPYSDVRQVQLKKVDRKLDIKKKEIYLKIKNLYEKR
jgi:hypothetical protein